MATAILNVSPRSPSSLEYILLNQISELLMSTQCTFGVYVDDDMVNCTLYMVYGILYIVHGKWHMLCMLYGLCTILRFKGISDSEWVLLKWLNESGSKF